VGYLSFANSSNHAAIGVIERRPIIGGRQFSGGERHVIFAIAVTLIEFVRGIARSVNVTTIPRMRSCSQAPFALESEIGNAGPLRTLSPEYHEKGMKQPAERDFGDIFRQ
jgi:hypothetical protein